MTNHDESSSGAEANFDLITVGAGAVGLAIAARFVAEQPEASVLVCEDTTFPAASTAAGAMIAPWSEVTAQSRDQTGFDARITEAERARRDWADELAGACVDGASVIVTKGIHVLIDPEATEVEVANAEAIRGTLQERGVTWETMDTDVVPGARPGLTALYIPDEFVVDAQRLSAWRRAELSRQGVRFLSSVVRLVEHGDKVVGVETAHGRTINAAAVVLASGTASRDMTPAAIRPLLPPLLTGSGAAVTVDSALSTSTEAIRTPNMALACGFHMLPTAAGRFYLGATNDIRDGVSTLPLVAEVDNLLRTGVRRLNPGIAHCGIHEIHSGRRPVAADALPMVGRIMDGLWMATGGMRDGLTNAPQTAERVVSEILHGHPTLPSDWRPVRPPTATWANDVAKYHAEANVRSMTDDPIEHLGDSRWDEQHLDKNLVDVGQIYESDFGSFVMPPDLAIMAQSGQLLKKVRSWTDAWKRCGLSELTRLSSLHAAVKMKANED